VFRIVFLYFDTLLNEYMLGIGKVVFRFGFGLCHFIVWILVWHGQCCVVMYVWMLPLDCFYMSLA